MKSASFILLQGVPTSIALEDLREDIRRVRGVSSLHELHVWQLSEQKIIASVHICVEREAPYMRMAKDIREVMHSYNIHSCTIQPEYEGEETKVLPSAVSGRCYVIFCERGGETDLLCVCV